MTFKRLTNRLDFFNRHYDLLVYDNHILIRYKPLFKTSFFPLGVEETINIYFFE